MAEKDTPYFVGFLPIPAGLKLFLLVVSLSLITGFAAGGILVGISQDDPGQAGFRFDHGRQTVTGVFESHPYPMLHITMGSEHLPTGKTIMVSGQGKTNIMRGRSDELDGKIVEISGVIVQRGDLKMLQIAGGRRGLKPTEEDGVVPVAEDLGTWRVKGEICDGKCLAGAMNPGRGIAHKACANLCLIGEIPPVFVSTKPIEGEEYFLIAGPDGKEMTQDTYNYVGQFVEAETRIERRGNLLVMRMDPAKMQVTP
ncbi:MAG: hypothetical protein OXR62_13970 [Ahrensia sp.]|nr:hypothetical protein [Ahrensia sp.]